MVCGKHHLDFFTALQEFKKEQADTEVMVAELSLGRKLKAAPKKTVDGKSGAFKQNCTWLWNLQKWWQNFWIFISIIIYYKFVKIIVFNIILFKYQIILFLLIRKKTFRLIYHSVKCPFGKSTLLEFGKLSIGKMAFGIMESVKCTVIISKYFFFFLIFPAQIWY